MTRLACPSLIIRCGAADIAEWIGPGTAMTCLEHSTAQLAVLRAPDRNAASTTTVPLESAAINRFRARNRIRVGRAPGGSSETRR